METYQRSPWFDEICGFLADVQKGNTDAAGALADFLEESECPVHRAKGKLLRRRWKLWQKKYAEERTFFLDDNPLTHTRYYHSTGMFLLYLRGKFSQEMYEASDPTNSEAYWSQ